ncbi:MAG: PsiF repeat protein [Betaproteobacteria bacterium]|nr:PsiF repeat protein [Betaproteobacteria bacterium]
MKTLSWIAALCLAAAPLAQAADAPAAEKKLTPQQNRMADCNKQAGDKKGADRRDFMRTCMHGDKAAAPAAAAAKPAAPAKPEAAAPAKPEAAKAADGAEKKLTPQQSRMGECNKQATAKGVKGPDRRAFMSDCLKNK